MTKSEYKNRPHPDLPGLAKAFVGFFTYIATLSKTITRSETDLPAFFRRGITLGMKPDLPLFRHFPPQHGAGRR